MNVVENYIYTKLEESVGGILAGVSLGGYAALTLGALAIFIKTAREAYRLEMGKCTNYLGINYKQYTECRIKVSKAAIEKYKKLLPKAKDEKVRRKIQDNIDMFSRALERYKNDMDADRPDAGRSDENRSMYKRILWPTNK